MPIFKRPDAEIHDEVHGTGYPLLLFAPGGLRSAVALWRHGPRCVVPLLLQPGTDKPHPAESVRRITDFLTRHTPAS